MYFLYYVITIEKTLMTFGKASDQRTFAAEMINTIDTSPQRPLLLRRKIKKLDTKKTTKIRPASPWP